MLMLLSSPMFLFHSGSSPSMRCFIFILRYARAFRSFLLLVSYRTAVQELVSGDGKAEMIGDRAQVGLRGGELGTVGVEGSAESHGEHREKRLAALDTAFDAGLQALFRVHVVPGDGVHRRRRRHHCHHLDLFSSRLVPSLDNVRDFRSCNALVEWILSVISSESADLCQHDWEFIKSTASDLLLPSRHHSIIETLYHKVVSQNSPKW